MWPFTKKEAASEPAPKAKPRLRAKRNYAAASVADRLNASWTSGAVSPDQLIFNNLKTLRARSREQFYNNDYAKRFVSMVRSNVIGQKGIQVQSKVEGMNGGGQDKPAQAAIEKAFKDWGKKQNCDLKGELSFVAFQSLALGTIAIDGEVLVRRHTSGKYAYQLEMIDPELLDVTYNTDLKSGNTVRFGIELDSLGRRVAYHLNTPSKSGADIYYSEYNQKHYRRVPASEILHLFLRDFVNQKRGLPWMATALQRMKMLVGYEDAALVSARAGASKMGFFTTEGGAEYTGDDVDEEGQIVENFEAGTMTQLPEGVSFQPFDPDYPKGEFGDFMKSCLRGIASGLSISYNTLANDLEGVNFSSMRHGAVEEREIWKCLQEWIIEQLVEPVFQDWLARSWELELISIPGRNGTRKPLLRPLEDYQPAAYQPRRWDWVDPLKDIQARKEEIALGITSVSAVIRDKGQDPETVWQDIEKEKEILSKLGINFGGLSNDGPNTEDKEQDESAQSDAEPSSD